MNGDEILEVLKQIRDEVRQTNVRLDQTNVRLESLDGRFDFLERRVSKGFEQLSEKMRESESSLSAEVVGLAKSMDQVRDLLATKLDDHNLLIRLEGRVRFLESRDSHAPPE